MRHKKKEFRKKKRRKKRKHGQIPQQFFDFFVRLS